MTSADGHVANRLCEFMKLLRNEWLSVRQIAQAMDWDMKSVRRWCLEFEANGMLLGGTKRIGKRGSLSRVFTLSAQWGGQA